MIAVEILIRPSVCETSGDALSVQFT